jgi:hypothetical protein
MASSRAISLVDEILSNRNTDEPSFAMAGLVKEVQSRMGKSAAHRQLEHPIGCVECRLNRAINFASGYLTTAKDLNILPLELDVHEHRDQILSQRFDVIQIRKSASEAIAGGFLDRLQSRLGSCSQRAGGCIVSCFGMNNVLA